MSSSGCPAGVDGHWCANPARGQPPSLSSVPRSSSPQVASEAAPRHRDPRALERRPGVAGCKDYIRAHCLSEEALGLTLVVC